MCFKQAVWKFFLHNHVWIGGADCTGPCWLQDTGASESIGDTATVEPAFGQMVNTAMQSFERRDQHTIAADSCIQETATRNCLQETESLTASSPWQREPANESSCQCVQRYADQSLIGFIH